MSEPKKALKSHLHYTVGWIAPLSFERAAAKAMFDEEHDKPNDFEQPKGDPNSYSWGEIGGHNIVLASLKAGLYGTTSAASSATMMLRSFPEIRFGLLVGIGGAIPRSGRDIRLGDIVVAQPSGSAGGVIQYDLLKARAGSVHERKDFLNSPPEVLLYALGNLQAQHEEEPSRVGRFLKEMKDRKPSMFEARSGYPGYECPGPSKDRLFRSTYNHQGGPDCSGCANEEEEKREPRKYTDPVIHYGVIASGNTLVKDAVAREELLQHIPDDCLCYEMEAAGLMNNFPCLVIRGISDYSDSHKNDHWQRYAAATAAAFAKELLGYVSAARVHQEEKALVCLEKISKIETDVAHIHQAAVSLQGRQNIIDIDAWLSPANVKVSHNTACNMKMQGTCTWFLQGEVFQSWKRCPSSFLWIHGIVGCGKTVLSSEIIENLRTDERGTHCVVLYYYFGSDSARDCLDGMVRTFLSQIIAATSKIPDNLLDRYRTCQQQSKYPETQSLLDDFHSTAGSLGEVKIVLDALDEVKAENRDGILSWIKESFSIQKNRESRIGLIALSRHEPVFQRNFEEICREVQISRSNVDCDIQKYVQDRLKTIQEFQDWKLSSQKMQQIEDTLLQRANGMFRLAALQVDSLRDCDSLDGLLQDLQSLPTTLTDMYDKILEDINPKRKSKAIRLLQLLAYAERPLRLDEVIAAILFDFSKNKSIVSSNELLQKDNLPNYYPSLILLEEVENDATWQDVQELPTEFNNKRRTPVSSDIRPPRCWIPHYFPGRLTKARLSPSRYTVVRLAHFSVTEYLRSGIHDEFQEQRVHSIILKLSLGYLESFSTILPDAPVSTVRRDYSFIDYASSLWPKHAKACEKDQKAQDLIMRFLTDPQALRAWMLVFNPEGGRRYLGAFCAAEPRFPGKNVEIPTSLQIATTFGLGGIVKALLDSDVSLSEQDTVSDFDKDDNELLQAFYSKGCSWGTMFPEGPILRTSPLYIACHHGWEDIVMLLLDKGLHLHDHAGPQGSPFTAACAQGHRELVKRLLDMEACQKKDGWHCRVFRLPHRRHGLWSPYSQHDSQVTPLFIYGHWESLKALLDAGVEFPPSNAIFKDWQTLGEKKNTELFLQALIRRKTSWVGSKTGLAIIKRALRLNVSLACLMRFAFPFIVESSETDLIDIIIRSNGAILGTELHDAARRGDITFLRAVLPRWKDCFDSCDPRGQSPMHFAAKLGHVEMIKILISAGFSPDVTDKSANRPLSLALMNHHINVLNLLSPDQDSIEQERTRLQKLSVNVAAIDTENVEKLKEIYGATAQISFIWENQVAKNAFRHAVLSNSTVVSDFMLSDQAYYTIIEGPIGLEAYASAIQTGNSDFLKIFILGVDARLEFYRIYDGSPAIFAQRNGRSDIEEFLNNLELKVSCSIRSAYEQMKTQETVQERLQTMLQTKK